MPKGPRAETNCLWRAHVADRLRLPARAVATPRAFNASATARRDVAPTYSDRVVGLMTPVDDARQGAGAI